jgi:uncharacterized protein
MSKALHSPAVHTLPTLHTLRVDDVPPQPWRNGGGQTRELLTWPPGQTDWQLRISVADIAADGPFSAFPGVQRWFVVLQGGGVQLGAGPARRRLTPDSPPFEFAGEDAPACTLLDGPTRDLNLMLRREAGRAALRPAAEPWIVDNAGVAGTAGVSGSALRGLFCADPVSWQAGADAPRPVPALSLLWSADDSRAWAMSPHPRAAPSVRPPRAWWLHFEPHSGTR